MALLLLLFFFCFVFFLPLGAKCLSFSQRRVKQRETADGEGVGRGERAIRKAPRPALIIRVKSVKMTSSHRLIEPMMS